jgi:nitrite reductase/ring-hydroxylating ferredoxin subunit
MTEQEWQVATLAEINEPGAVEFTVGEGDWPFRGLVVRWESQVYAYANSCAHVGHRLNLHPDKFFNGDDSLLICSSHGALFEPDTGICVGGPCAGARLRSLTCCVKEGIIFVTAPDSQRS